MTHHKLHRFDIPAACLVAFTFFLGGCAADIPVTPEEISNDTFMLPAQVGTPALWRGVLDAAARDGKPRLHMINRGDDALLARINLIRGAQKSIRIQTFMWGNDECGRYIMWELIRAVKQRGVHVQVLADQMFSQVETDVLAWLSTVDPKLEIRLHNPNAERLNPDKLASLGAALADFKGVMVRMHDKTFIVDDDIVITGGRNYFNEYYDRSIGLNYKDRDLLVAGPGAAAIIDSFNAFWNTPRSIPAADLTDVKELLDSGKFPRFTTRTDFAFHGLFDQLGPLADDAGVIRHKLIEPLLPVARIEWVFDHPAKNDANDLNGDSISSKRLRAMVLAAKEKVLIQSPYFILNERAVDEIKAARKTQPVVPIIVSTNSLAATDAWYVYGVTFKQKRMLLMDLGIQIHELKPIPQDMHLMANLPPLLTRPPTPAERAKLAPPPFEIDPGIKPVDTLDDSGRPVAIRDRRNAHTGTPPFMSLHAKSCVIDGRIAFIGSYNVHPRSQNLDTEVGLIVEDEAFARLLQADIERDIAPANSYLVGARQTLLPITPVGELLARVSEALPVDVWPARHTSSFELRESCEPVPLGDPRFHEHWKDVGTFPLLKPFDDRAIKTRAAKMLGWFIKPIM